VKYGIPVKHVLLDNHSLGKIGKEQRAAEFRSGTPPLHNPDWAAHAELCGATGIKAVRREQLDASMARLFAADGPGHAAHRAGPRAAVAPSDSSCGKVPSQAAGGCFSVPGRSRRPSH
jgi:thiamine pyrophosphate-dependent acetolactate synthase large subunit-like protein